MLDMASAARTGRRSACGCQARPWDTRAGTIGLNIPKLRKGSYFPTFLEPRRTAENRRSARSSEDADGGRHCHSDHGERGA